jgi:fructose-1-phosphate kinase PfkB-like protein
MFSYLYAAIPHDRYFVRRMNEKSIDRTRRERDALVRLPDFTAGVVNRVEQQHSQPGGKGVNVAAALAVVAGILAGQLGGFSLPQTARLASAFSLDALTRDESVMTSRDRIEALMDDITLDECDADLR